MQPRAPRGPRGQRARNWMFVINNPIDTDAPSAWLGVKYAIWQLETGEAGTPHYQGYVAFNDSKTLAEVKIVGPRGHWEVRRGTHDQAVAYCTKEETRTEGPWTLGQAPNRQGKRTDLDSLKEALDAGKSEATIAQEQFPTWSRNYKAIERYKRIKIGNNRNWPVFTTVYWGPPGVGKSRRAALENPGAYWLTKPRSPTSGLWWDGYDAHETVVIDEFTGWMTRDFMCRLCDRYPMQVETKGGATSFLAKRIIITSNHEPNQWWSNIGLGPMARRLEGDLGVIHFMGEPWEPVPLEPLVGLDEVPVHVQHPLHPAYDSDADEGPLDAAQVLADAVDELAEGEREALAIMELMDNRDNPPAVPGSPIRIEEMEPEDYAEYCAALEHAGGGPV